MMLFEKKKKKKKDYGFYLKENYREFDLFLFSKRRNKKRLVLEFESLFGVAFECKPLENEI